GLFRICALRMRAIISPIGSLTAIATLLPARLHEARNEALVAELAQRDAADAVLAIERARTAGQLAAVTDARLRRLARQFGELERGREAFLHRNLLVHRDRLELSAARRKRLRHLAPSVVLLDRTLLRHSFAPYGSAYEDGPHCRNGKLKAVSSARASLSVRA